MKFSHSNKKNKKVVVEMGEGMYCMYVVKKLFLYSEALSFGWDKRCSRYVV